MVKVRITDKKGKTWISHFPKSSLKDVKLAGKRINPNIRKVEYYRRRTSPRRTSPYGINLNRAIFG